MSLIESGPRYGFNVQDLKGRISLEDVRTLVEWVQNEKIPNYNQEMIALFYMACKNDVENTKDCIKAYYQARTEAPELFDNRDLSRSDIQHQLSVLQYCVMPQRTKEGQVVVLHRLVDFNPHEYHMDVAMKVLFMLLDVILYKDPPTGLIVLFDMRGVGIRHLTRIKLSAVKKFFVYVQEGLPLQLKAVHVINCVWFIDKVLTLIKPFYNPELLKLLHLHKPDMDLDDFFENCIPKSCLPSDLGGVLPSSEEIHLQTWREMEKLQDFYNEEQQMRLKE